MMTHFCRNSQFSLRMQSQAKAKDQSRYAFQIIGPKFQYINNHSKYLNWMVIYKLDIVPIEVDVPSRCIKGLKSYIFNLTTCITKQNVNFYKTISRTTL